MSLLLVIICLASVLIFLVLCGIYALLEVIGKILEKIGDEIEDANIKKRRATNIANKKLPKE